MPSNIISHEPRSRAIIFITGNSHHSPSLRRAQTAPDQDILGESVLQPPPSLGDLHYQPHPDN